MPVKPLGCWICGKPVSPAEPRDEIGFRAHPKCIRLAVKKKATLQTPPHKAWTMARRKEPSSKQSPDVRARLVALTGEEVPAHNWRSTHQPAPRAPGKEPIASRYRAVSRPDVWCGGRYPYYVAAHISATEVGLYVRRKIESFGRTSSASLECSLLPGLRGYQ
jgi:hypothetical protein